MTLLHPLATTDLDRAKRDLDESGMCLVADALPAAEVARLRAAVVEAAFQDVDDGVACIDGGGANQRVWTLLNRGQIFHALATHPLAIELMTHVLGGQPGPSRAVDELPGFLLSNLSANIAGPGGEAMSIHQDQGYIPGPWPSFALNANIVWMLDDTTAANGATRVVAGSHRGGDSDPVRQEQAAVPVEGAAGTALVFDGRLWHGTGRNVTADQKRHVILAYYCQPWLRTQENHCVSIDPDVASAASPAIRRLIGFDMWGAIGAINGMKPSDFGGVDPAPAAHHRRPPATVEQEEHR